MKRGISAIAFVLLGFVFPGVANAETPPGCGSAAQIGPTAHVKWRGDNIASVKQFAGCGKNFAYVYIRESFRATGRHWNTQTSVAVYRSASDRTPDHKGWNSDQFAPVELWSKGTGTLSKRTAAYGLVSVQQAGNHIACTGKRC